MLEFPPNTYMLEYRDGAYLCNGTKRVEAPLNLETLEEAVRQCPKLQQISLEDAPFGDGCFPILARIPKLSMLGLLRGRQIAGHGLELLKDHPLKDLFLQRTALDDEGLAQAAQIGKLKNICIAACHRVTPAGLLAISWRDKLRVSDTDMQDEEGQAGLFTEAERKAYEDARTYKVMKNRLSLDSPELQDSVHALQEFFGDMNQWERMAEQKGYGSQADINALFARQVSWTPRPGWRPIHLFWTRGGTYTDYHLVAGERVTKSKFWLYTEQGIFYYRYFMRLIDGKWMIDNAQCCREGALVILWAVTRTDSAWIHERRKFMKFEIIPKSDMIPSYDPNAVAVKYIEDNSHGEQYEEDEITPDLISKILHEVPKGIEIILYLDPDGEGRCGCLEVVSDGDWLSLCYDYNETETYFCYNSEFADTVAQLEEVDLRDENVYSPIDYDGQIPVPKCQAITDMDAGVKAIEYFIRTGMRYPGIDWGYCP